MKNYPLTTIGVHDWQEDYHLAEAAVQADERNYIALAFYEWLEERFQINTRQLEYVYRLPQDFVRTVQDEVIGALLHGLPIILEREPRPEVTPSGEGSSDSVKVTELKKKREAEAEEEEDDPGDTAGRQARPTVDTDDSQPEGLTIRTYYRWR